MNIEEYADILNIQLRITYYPNQNGRWTASFEGVETKADASSGILDSTYGNAESPDEAINDYVEKIRGRLLVINATGGDKRREFIVPATLYGRVR